MEIHARKVCLRGIKWTVVQFPSESNLHWQYGMNKVGWLERGLEEHLNTEQGAKADLGSEEEELEYRETVTGTQKLQSGEIQTR